MFNWIRAIFDRRSKADLLAQIDRQADTIQGLMSRPVVQLAKLAWDWHHCLGAFISHQKDTDALAARAMLRLGEFIKAHRDELHCLADTPEDEADVKEAEARIAAGNKAEPYRGPKGDEGARDE